MLSILIQRFWMEFIDDFEVLDGTYQRFWNSEVPDRIYQRYWNSEFQMEPIDDFSWNSEVLQFLTLKMKVLQFPDFGDNRFFDFWTLKTTGSLVLDFGDDRSAAFLEGISFE
ncbi:hypothetical protein RhiirB3_390824, partial [Rhizophagus irregularis]